MIWYKYRKNTLLVMRHILKVVNPLGVKDTVTTKYMRQNEIFADAFNYFVYGGEQVINPESLEELDTCEVDVPYGGEKGAKQPVQRTRDVIKSVIAMMDKRTAYFSSCNRKSVKYPLCNAGKKYGV